MSRQDTIAHSSSSKSILIVLTTTLLLFVSCGSTIQSLLLAPDADTNLSHGVSSSEDKKEGADIVKVSAVYEAVIPICKIQLAFFCSFIRTYSFIEKILGNEDFTVPLPQSNYFRILLRRIISPNAP